MLTMKAQYSLRNAESYFREHLGVGDYYMEGRSVSGQWIGEGTSHGKLQGCSPAVRRTFRMRLTVHV
jgi:hypothetical protein